MSIGENIKKYRKAAGLTQPELANQLGISRGMVHNYETGASHLPVDFLRPLAKALNVSVEALLKED